MSLMKDALVRKLMSIEHFSGLPFFRFLFLMISIQKQIVFIAEDVTFLVCLVHHIAVDEALVDLVLALGHFTYSLYVGLLVNFVMQFVIKASLAVVCGLFDHELTHLVN